MRAQPPLNKTRNMGRRVLKPLDNPPYYMGSLLIHKRAARWAPTQLAVRFTSSPPDTEPATTHSTIPHHMCQQTQTRYPSPPSDPSIKSSPRGPSPPSDPSIKTSSRVLAHVLPPARPTSRVWGFEPRFEDMPVGKWNQWTTQQLLIPKARIFFISTSFPLLTPSTRHRGPHNSTRGPRRTLPQPASPQINRASLAPTSFLHR
ncbi:unnamed protein product [Linum trigynum]|uniref:Uncharacterized protein n=1 Tax=Linum trigynum TaxID=586398 RepID=A0AAV2G0J7_9ROSI